MEPEENLSIEPDNLDSHGLVDTPERFSRKKVLVAITALLILSAIFIFFAAALNNQTSEISTTDTILQPTTKIANINDTSTWTLYEDKQHGYSIKLPPAWDVNGAFIGPKNIVSSMRDITKVKQADRNKAIFWNYSPYFTTDFIEANGMYSKQLFKGANIEGYMYTSSSKDSTLPYIAILFPVDDVRKEIILSVNDPSLAKTLELIASTFFLHDVQPLEHVKEWKEYTNSEFGFSFQYPSEKIQIKPQPFNERFSYLLNNNQNKNIERPENPLFVLGYSTLEPLVIEDSSSPGDPLHLVIYPNPNNLSINEWFEKYDIYPYDDISGYAELIRSKEPITIGGKQSYYWGIPGQKTTYAMLVSHKNNMIIIHVNDKPDLDSEGYNIIQPSISDEMIASFKLL